MGRPDAKAQNCCTAYEVAVLSWLQQAHSAALSSPALVHAVDHNQPERFTSGGLRTRGASMLVNDCGMRLSQRL